MAWDPSTAPHPAVTVDAILFTIAEGELRVLLVRRELPPYKGRWALPGGFVRMDESLDEAARRELREETGAQVRWLEQLYTFGDIHRDPARRAISVAYFALIDAASIALRAGSDADEASWHALHSLPSKLAFDHREMIDYALERLRYKTEYEPVAFQLLPERFGLSELQRVYEVILGAPLDKRNFRRKILGLGIVQASGRERSEGRGRPAALYRFRPNHFARLGGGVVLAFRSASDG